MFELEEKETEGVRVRFEIEETFDWVANPELVRVGTKLSQRVVVGD